MDLEEQRNLRKGRWLLGQGVFFVLSGVMRKIAAVAAVLLTCLMILTGRGEPQTLSEYQLKAAFLFNFAKFVEWPASAFPDPAAPIIFGVLGVDPFGPNLEQAIAGKTVNNRPFVVKRFATVQTMEPCHMLFISAAEQAHLPQILAALKDKHTLTISEVEDFLALGGMINFLTVDNKVRFEIHQTAAERAGLKLSSKLLSLAIAVKTNA